MLGEGGETESRGSAQKELLGHFGLEGSNSSSGLEGGEQNPRELSDHDSCCFQSFNKYLTYCVLNL